MKSNPTVKAHSECMNYVKENVTSFRLKSQKKISNGTEEEQLKEKSRFKKILAFELLFNNLALLLMIPEMLEEIEADIEELKICFSKVTIKYLFNLWIAWIDSLNRRHIW
jgi:hypothetical protein